MQNISDFADDVVRNITNIGGGSGNQPKPDYTPIDKADVGKYVDYKPNSGTYEKAILDQYSGETTNTAFTTQEDLKWRIWNVDDKNLYLISDKATTQQLKLRGAIGYNNGVTLLDNICDTCYKGNYTGINVKNLKVEDLEAVMEIPKDAKYSTQPYAEFIDYAPYIWRQNESSSWEDAKDNRSTPYALTTQTASRAAMRPWYNAYASVSLPTGIYKDIMGKERIWLSSRYASFIDGNIAWYFGLQMVGSGTLYSEGGGSNNGYLYISKNGSSGMTTASVRPFVTIPRDSFTGIWDEAHENLSIKPI